MIITIFRSRLRSEHQHEYEQLAPRINNLAQSMPGFISIKTFVAPDAERVFNCRICQRRDSQCMARPSRASRSPASRPREILFRILHSGLSCGPRLRNEIVKGSRVVRSTSPVITSLNDLLLEYLC